MKQPIRIPPVSGLALRASDQAKPEIAPKRDVTPIGSNACLHFVPTNSEAATIDMPGPTGTLQA